VSVVSGTAYWFFNGTAEGSDSTGSYDFDFNRTGGGTVIGMQSWDTGPYNEFNGWIDDLIVKKGVGDHTSGFTPSTTELSYTANNSFTPVSMTAAQQVTDSPTDDAENDIGNYATFNPLGNEQGGLYGGVANLAEGNTRRSAADDNWYNAYSTIAMNTTQGGKWYAEFEYITSSATTLYAGVALKDEEVSAAWQLGSTKQKSWAVNGSNGQSYFNNSGTAGTGGALSTGDIIMVAYDADNETLYLGVNDSWFGSAEPDTSTSPTYSSVPTVSGDNVFFAAGVYGTTVDCKANFGNEAFAYTIPTGYKALSTANLPAQTAAASVTPLTSPSFTGNANADGPFVWLGYSPNQSGTSTINGNTITWGTHADALAGGMKLRTASTSYNSTGTNTISIAVDVNFEDNARAQ
jgi:hypothetical protein